MPEGHTIHRISRDHAKWIGGQVIKVSSPQGRFAEEAKRISGKRLMSIEAHGKHLFYQWSPRRFMHVHLGLYGKFRLHQNPPPLPRGAVRIRMQAKERTIDLNGPNCCELIDVAGYQQIKQRLGEDPLREDADVKTVWNRVRTSRAPIGTLLLNQSVVAGVGNIYRAELLFLVGVHPNRRGCELEKPVFDALWGLTVKLLKVGLKYNRIITVTRDEADKPLSRLSRQERIHIYKRENCPKCDGPISCWELANRKIYACERCQA